MSWSGFQAGVVVAVAACAPLDDDEVVPVPAAPPVRAAFASHDAADPVAPGPPPNIVLVVLDDVGVEIVSTWDRHPDAAPTPTLDDLADDGLVFRNAYAMPWCSPTRVGLLTGRSGVRWGMGRAIRLADPNDVSLPDEAITLPELLRDAAPVPYTSALAGKWHLTQFEQDAPNAPLRQGFVHHDGSLGNLQHDHSLDGEPQSYYDWERVTDGVVERTDVYATTATFDAASGFAATLPEPFFLMVAPQAAHSPWVAPPEELHDYDLEAEGGRPWRYRAIIEAADRELGRFLDGIEPGRRSRTVVVVVGDNGTDRRAFLPPLDGRRGKSTVWELGVRVPWVMSGPGVARGETEALAHTDDLFATLAHLAGVDDADLPDGLDSYDLFPVLQDPSRDVRDTVGAVQHEPNGFGAPVELSRMARDHRYKLVLDEDGSEALFDIGDDLVEGIDLLKNGEDDLSPSMLAVLQRLRDAMWADADGS